MPVSVNLYCTCVTVSNNLCVCFVLPKWVIHIFDTTISCIYSKLYSHTSLQQNQSLQNSNNFSKICELKCMNISVQYVCVILMLLLAPFILVIYCNSHGIFLL